MQQVYPHLISYFDKLKVAAGDTILVPLCGKSLDIQWLLDKNLQVIGVDVSAIAIEGLKESLDLNFSTSTKGPFDVYTAKGIQLWQGDFMNMQASFVPNIDAIYDKAALTALPKSMRKSYSQLIQTLCSSHTNILLNCFEYPQNEMKGPPFAVFTEELQALYSEQFTIQLLHEESMLQQLAKFKQRGLSSFIDEKVYLLSPAKD